MFIAKSINNPHMHKMKPTFAAWMFPIWAFLPLSLFVSGSG